MDDRRVRVLVSGRVQGVFFRTSLRDEASRHGVTGWVRNLPDGRVEAELQGEPDAVDAVLAWCADGPPHAEVTAVDTAEAVPEPAGGGFWVR